MEIDKTKSIICILLLTTIFFGLTAFNVIDIPLLDDRNGGTGDTTNTTAPVYIPPVDTGGVEQYYYFQMVMEFEEIDYVPFEPLGFIPAIDPDFPDFPMPDLPTQIWQIYNYDAPSEIVDLDVDSVVYSTYDYPVETANFRNPEYALYVNGGFDDYEGTEYWFNTQYEADEPETHLWLIDGVLYYDGGFLVKVSTQIPVYGFNIAWDAVYHVGNINISWIKDGSGNRFVHEWM